MADRDQEALDCAARRREREARAVPAEAYACRCDHDHPPEVSWCDLCENPVFHGAEPTMAKSWDDVTITVIPDPLWTAEMEAAAQGWLALLRSLEDDAHHGQDAPAS